MPFTSPLGLSQVSLPFLYQRKKWYGLGDSNPPWDYARCALNASCLPDPANPYETKWRKARESNPRTLFEGATSLAKMHLATNAGRTFQEKGGRGESRTHGSECKHRPLCFRGRPITTMVTLPRGPRLCQWRSRGESNSRIGVSRRPHCFPSRPITAMVTAP